MNDGDVTDWSAAIQNVELECMARQEGRQNNHLAKRSGNPVRREKKYGVTSILS